MVKPAQTWDLHRSAEGFDLDAIYSVQETRIVSSDNVARHENIHYQILVEKDGPNLRGKTVTIETRLNGSIKIRYGEKYYNYMVKNAK